MEGVREFSTGASARSVLVGFIVATLSQTARKDEAPDSSSSNGSCPGFLGNQSFGVVE